MNSGPLLHRITLLIVLLGTISSLHGEPCPLGHTSQTYYDPNQNNGMIKELGN